MLLDAQPQADPEGLTGFYRRGLGNQLRLHQLGGRRGSV
jgi:hypothetical protein